jgi:hypothetical protein
LNFRLEIDVAGGFELMFIDVRLSAVGTNIM